MRVKPNSTVRLRGPRFYRLVGRLGHCLLLACVALVALGAIVPSVGANEPNRQGDADRKAVFNVAADGNTSTVRGVAFGPDGKTIISAGYDKVIRIWDLGTAQTARYIEEPWPQGRAGEIYAIALSPDGKLLAVGGYMDTNCPSAACGNIRLYEVASGALKGVLAGHENIILSIAFSSDGSRLASSGPDQTTRVWDVVEQRELAQFPFPGGKGRASKVAFLNDNAHVVTVSDTPFVHVYEVGSQQPVATLTANENLHAIAVSDDGRHIAAGGDSGNIHVWEWPGQEHREVPGNGTHVSTLAFGHKASAGEIVATSSSAPYASRVFNVTTGEMLSEYPTHDNVITATAYSADGTRIATAGGSDWSIYVWSPLAPADGRRLGGGGKIVFAAGFIEAPRDGRSGSDEYIAWGYLDPCPGQPSCPKLNGALQFAMRIPGPQEGALGDPEPWPRRQTQPSAVQLQAKTIATAGTLSALSERDPERFPKLVLLRSDGTQTELSTRRIDRGEDHTTFSFDPSGSRIASGGRNGVLDIIDLEGNRLADLAGHSGDVWSVAFDRSGRLLVSGSADKTLRLWNSQTGELIVSLLYIQRMDASGRPQPDWIMWTPQGYFTGSARGEELIRAYVEQGAGRSAVLVTPKNVREHFFRPKLIERAIQLGSAERAIEEARSNQLITNFRLRDVTSSSLPSFKILDVENGSTTRDGRVSFRLARSIEGSEISSYTVYVNDNKVDVTPLSARYGELDAVQFTVPLYEGKNRIRIVATNAIGYQNTVELEMTQNGEGPLDTRETLYIVAIGVNHYPNITGCVDPKTDKQRSCDLQYPDQDAIAFEKMLRDRMGEGRGHKKVVSRVLFNGAGGADEPTFQNIDDALNVLLSAGPKDTAVLFLAGHGTNRSDQYQFLPTDARPGNTVFNSAIFWSRILQAITSPKGRRMLFLDTCRAASIYGQRAASFVNTAFDKDVYIFLGSRGDQEALEPDALKHGVFTYGLQQGLEDWKAADPIKKVIKAKMLGDFVEKFVSEYTNDEQEPYAVVPPDNFVMVRLP